ncbi:hypothetical protein [Bdellovibrio sp. HCB-162]|uniref:hypothetical protein n=1 Tax=Bdellovibrio sp. HCB-162 TaxID=3394234 RepID=UPI0039BC5F97
MKLQKKNLSVFLLLSQLVLLASCGQMQANVERSSGVFDQTSSTSLPTNPDPSFYAEASEASEVREVQEKKPASEVKPTSQKEEETATPQVSENEEEKGSSETPEPANPSALPAPAQAEMNGPGVLKPTVYYFYVVNEDKNTCSANTKVTMHGTGGKALLKVCPKTAEACGLQGSCAIVQKGVTRAFNVIGRVDGQDHFFEIEKNGCRFGYGVNSSCLDPFYTLAADLTIYKPGEVIYVPAVVGLELPDGSKHSGYFVIRDKGRGIIGRGRFDFFSGYFSWLDPKNPFNKLGLGDVKTNIPYYRVTGESAKKFLLSRKYPQIPVHANGGPIK